MIEFDTVFKYVKKPELFGKSSASLWDDEHISKGMLEAHLALNNDTASRKHEFIDCSVNWIYEYTKLSKGTRVLDLGCGPGLYAERLARLGLNVTGIDFSKRSIEHAKSQSKIKCLDIEYIYQNYLQISYENEFDLIIMIYCDFGVLPDLERDILLDKVFKALKPGGKFIFDVFTPERMKSIVEKNTWNSSESGYWRPYPYLCIESEHVYQQHDTFMRQYVIIDEKDKVEVYRIWDHTYSKDTIRDVLINKGFKQLCFFSDVSGMEYKDNPDTMGIVAEKS